MKLFFTTDTHFHSKQKGYTTYTDYSLDVRRVLNEESNHSLLFHLGDVFNNKHMIELEMFKNLLNGQLTNFFSRMKSYWITGNHDVFNWLYHPLLNSLEGADITICNDFTTLSIDRVTIDVIPHMADDLILAYFAKNKKAKSKGPHILMGHFGLREAKTATSNCEVAAISKDEIPNIYDIVILGHIHKQQTIDNIFFPGSPYQINFSSGLDTGEGRLWYLDTKTLEIEEVSLPSRYPRYIKHEIFGVYRPVDLTPNDFHWIECPPELLITYRDSYPDVRVTVGEQYRHSVLEQQHSSEAAVDPLQAIEEYVKLHKLNNDYVNKGVEILQKGAEM